MKKILISVFTCLVALNASAADNYKYYCEPNRKKDGSEILNAPEEFQGFRAGRGSVNINLVGSDAKFLDLVNWVASSGGNFVVRAARYVYAGVEKRRGQKMRRYELESVDEEVQRKFYLTPIKTVLVEEAMAEGGLPLNEKQFGGSFGVSMNGRNFEYGNCRRIQDRPRPVFAPTDY